jgi:hypothetical protein
MQPVCFILGSLDWQRGYDLAIERSGDKPADELKNPFDADRSAFFGFEEGRLDAGRIGKVDS